MNRKWIAGMAGGMLIATAATVQSALRDAEIGLLDHWIGPVPLLAMGVGFFLISHATSGRMEGAENG